MDTPQTLAADMLKAAAAALVESKAVVAKGALNVKNAARKNVEASAPVHNAHAAYAITYDTKLLKTSAEAEIGYDKDKDKGQGKRTGPGGLGSILEYGSAHSPPHRDLGRALDTEEPRFVAAIEAIGARLL